MFLTKSSKLRLHSLYQPTAYCYISEFLNLHVLYVFFLIMFIFVKRNTVLLKDKVNQLSSVLKWSSQSVSVICTNEYPDLAWCRNKLLALFTHFLAFIGKVKLEPSFLLTPCFP